MAWVRPVVEFSPTTNPLDAPSYVDITDDIRGEITWGYGRGSEFDQANPGQATFILDNRSRKYDPHNVSGTYYGNLRPRRKVRITVSGTTVFTGYVTGWNQTADWVNGDAVVEVTAIDPLTVLAQAKFPADPYHHAVKTSGPYNWWRMTETEGGSYLPSQTGQAPALAVYTKVVTDLPGIWAQGRLLTGGNVSTSVSFIQLGLSLVYPWGTYTGPSSYELWVKMRNNVGGAAGQSTNLMNIQRSGATSTPIVLSIGAQPNDMDQTIYDGSWHHLVYTTDGTNYKAYFDGKLQRTIASGSYLAAAVANYLNYAIGGTGFLSFNYSFDGYVRDVAFYNKALTATEVDNHWSCATSLPIELSGARVSRILDMISWPSADRVIDAGYSVVAGQGQIPTGNVLSYLQDIAKSEGGLLFAQPDGKIRFRARHYGNDDTASRTVQATYDDAASATLRFESVRPAWDDQYIINDVTSSGVSGKPFSLEDPTSIQRHLRRSQDVTGLKTTEIEAISRAEGIIRRYANPAFTDIRNKSVILNGTSQYGTYTLPATHASITVSCWFKPVDNAPASQAVIGFNQSGGGQALVVYWANSGVSRFTIFSAASTFTHEAATSRAWDTWYHVALTITGNTATLFIDGTQVAQVTGMPAADSPAINYTMMMGARLFGGAANWAEGQMDEFIYFNSVLTGPQITALAAGKTTEESVYVEQVIALNPYLWWRLAETSGTTMVDNTGNGRNGTYSGSPTLNVDGVIPGPQVSARLEEVVCNARYSSAQLADAIARRIGDRVQVNWKENAQAAQVNYYGHIEAYRHVVNLSELSWRYTFVTQPTDLEPFFKLDTNTLGSSVVMAH